jgi:TPR repeat protein
MATLYERSADAGYGEAAVNLGAMYETGNGVARDRERALNYYERAAAANFPRGMTLYANLTSTFGERRRDATRDSEALAWYVRAAQAGEPEAAIRLALIHTLGIGVTPDRTAALRWLDVYDRQQRDASWRNQVIETRYAPFASAVRAGLPFVEPRVTGRDS